MIVKKISSILLISILLSACSDASSKDDAVVKGLMEDQKISKKQAKCLIKETKPLVKKDEWNKYAEMWNEKEKGTYKMNDNDMDTLMSVGFSMMSIGKKCNVTF